MSGFFAVLLLTLTLILVVTFADLPLEVLWGGVVVLLLVWAVTAVIAGGA